MIKLLNKYFGFAIVRSIDDLFQVDPDRVVEIYECGQSTEANVCYAPDGSAWVKVA